MTFTRFDRSGHRELSDMVIQELDALGRRLGLAFKVEGGTIGGSNLVLKLDARSSDPNALDADFSRYCRHYGLQPEDYGAEFTLKGTRYRLTGIKPSRPKYPLEIERVSDRRAFKFSAAAHVIAQIVNARSASRGPVSKAPAQNNNGNPLASKFAPQQPVVGEGMFDHVAQF